MIKYQPSLIEPKWQKRWEEEKLYNTDLNNTEKKYYCLVELPYTSGDLHMGHWFTFNYGDTLARFKRHQGYNSFLPIGFDAFGLPAENAAIKRGVHPRDWTLGNVDNMVAQFKTMGASFDWNSLIIACNPDYYKWNQWIFLKMYEKGLVYRGKILSNWCPSCQTVLANENVEAGKCWRCGSEVVQKEVDQWLFKITAYADELIWQNPPQANWPKALTDAQNKWIGKSEGIEIKFKVKSLKLKVEAFTVYPETIFGVTYMVLAPEHPLVKELTTKEYYFDIEDYIKVVKKKSELERKENKEKTGVFTGSYAINPVNGKELPIWVSDYVIGSYGTGAVMGVPGSDKRDFEFAKKFDLPVKRVIGKTAEDNGDIASEKDVLEVGVLVNSGEFSGLNTPDPAKEKIKDWMVENGFGKRTTQYHLHDWSISRQRYWGTPIPFIHCEKCGIVPFPEKDLPVELPYEVDYKPQGKPPLATAEEWMNVKCPKCGGEAKRDPETMDTFMDSSWYFFRYLDPKNDKKIFDSEVVNKWMPLKIYIGGSEHTLGHALYSRYFTKFFHDLGLVNFDEYAKMRVHHGVILGPDGHRMSKSRGNIVNPEREVKKYGADAVRVYLSFVGPFDIVTSWNPKGLDGTYHFLQRVWGLIDKTDKDAKPSKQDLQMMHRTIKKITEDMEEFKFNTSVAKLMEWLNHLSRKEKISLEEYKTYLILLSPFAPHISEELWSHFAERNKSNWSVHQQPWPKYDEEYLSDIEVSIVIQINGKVRDQIKVSSDILQDQPKIQELALKSEKIIKFLSGKSPKKIIYVPGKILSLVV